MGKSTETPPPIPSALSELVDDDPRLSPARELLRFCDAELSANPDPLQAARLHYEMALISEHILEDLSQASIHYDHSLSFSPEHLPSIQGARRVHLALSRYREALPLFDAEVRISSDSARKAMLLYRKACVLENQVKDVARARGAYQAALDLDRSNVTILKAIERSHIASEDRLGLQHIYEALPNAIGQDARHRAALIVQRARHLPPDKRDAVAELYESALRLDPEIPGAYEALERIYQGGQRWLELINALERMAATTTDDSLRASALYRIGHLHEQRLSEQSEAISALARAAEVAPGDQLIREDLARLYEETDDWESLVRLLHTFVERTDDIGEQVAVLHRLGQLYETQLDDEDEAVRCYAMVLEREPTYVPGLQAMGNLLSRRDDWLALVSMHNSEAEASTDVQRRATAHARIAEIYETRLKRPVDAADHHAKALALVPGYPASFKALVRLYSQAGLNRDLIELYERAVDDAPDDSHRIAYLFKVGSLWEDSLANPAQAQHAYKRVLKLDGDSLGAIHALQRVTERSGHFEELVAALELEADKTSKREQVLALLHRAGTVLDDQLGDRDAALLRFRRALEIKPDFVPALASLGRIYYRAGRWNDLLDMYRRELGVTPKGPSAVALLIRMGELSEGKLGLPDQAIKHYRMAAEMDPTARPALRALERKLIERGAWKELPGVFELELSGLTEPQARAVTRFRLGRVYETRLDDPIRALRAYEQAVSDVEDYRPALDAIIRLRSQRRAWSQLVDDLARDERTGTDPGRVAGALLRQAEIWRDQLSDSARAVGCFEALLDLEPGHLAALLALEELYAKAGNYEALAMVYRRQAEVLDDPGAQVAALRELARVQEHQGVGDAGDLVETCELILQHAADDQQALEALARHGYSHNNRVLLTRVEARLGASADDPGVAAYHFTVLARTLESVDPQLSMDAYAGALSKDATLIATRGLARMARELDDNLSLCQALEREAGMTLQRRVAAELLVESGRIRLDRLGDVEGSVAALRGALDLDPESAPAAERISEVLLEMGMVDELVDILSRSAGSAGDPDRVASLWLQVAEIYADRIGNVGAAIATLTRARKSSPDHVPTMVRLAELYTANRQWSEAAELLDKVLAAPIDEATAMRAHVGLAAICDENLNDTDRAIEHIQKVLAVRADHPGALARLSRVELKRGNVDASRAAAKQLVDVADDPVSKADALLQIARLDHEAGDTSAAMNSLAGAVELDGPGGEPAAAFKEMARSTEDWRRYAGALRGHLRQPRRRLELAPTYLELAMVQADKLENIDGAVATLEQGLTETSADSKVAVALATRLRWAGRVDEAIGHLRRLLAADVSRAESWRSLAITLDAAGRGSEAQLALEPLLLLGEATEEETRTVRSKNRLRARPGSLDLAALRTIAVDSSLSTPQMDLLASLYPAMGKLFPGDLDGLGLSKRDKISSRTPSGLRSLADELAAVFGVEEYDLYEHMLPEPLVSVEAFDPPAVVVSERVSALPESLQTFLLAHAMMMIGAKIYPIEKLSSDEMSLLLGAAGRSVVGGFGAGTASESDLEELSNRIRKAVPRKYRRNAEEAARYYVASPGAEISTWMRSVQLTAMRAAMLACGDLSATVELFQRADSRLDSLNGAQLLAASPLLSDLLRFWISERAMELRRRAGLLPL